MSKAQIDTTQEAQMVKGPNGAEHLVICLPTQTPTPSKSGKSLVVASTNGNRSTTAMVNGRPLVIGVNAYVSNR